MLNPNKRAVSPVIAIVLLLMMTVAAAGAAYFWLTQMQSGIQEQSTKSIENIMQQSGRRLVAQAAICEPTAPEGMVAWYEFYEGEGSKTHDSSKNSNNGTIYGANWTDGKIGQALDFDGVDDYVDVGDPIPSGEITYSFWTKVPDWTPGEIQSWIGQWNGAYDNKITIGEMDLNRDGVYDLFIGSYDGNHHGAWVSGKRMEDFNNKWVFVVGRYSSATGDWAIFINGVDKTDGVVNLGTGALDSTVNAFLGAANNQNSPYRHLNGIIDDVRIYDRALTQEEINETYKGKMKVKMTVRNVGSVKVPEAKFVANLKKDGTTVDTDTYTTTSSIDTDELKTLTFYFNEMRPGGSYNVNIPGIDVSQTVSCQSLE